MLITVIICTYNRCDCLKDILNCLLLQKTDKNFDYEVVIVDNNSKDKTKEIAESFIFQFQGRLRYFFEGKQGKPHALNLGIKEAKGDIIVSTDDDCILEENYLINIFKTFKELKDEIGFIGGKILPYWVGSKKPVWLDEVFLQPSEIDQSKPNWFKIFFEGPLGILDYGQKSFVIDYNQQKQGIRLFYGANMAFRKEVFKKFGTYRLDKRLTQDTEICIRLLKGGVKGLYAPDVKVYHKIKTNRITPGYYYRWYFLRGQYLENDEKYDKKFYHPLGIQFVFFSQTAKLFLKSLFEHSLSQKIYCRCQGVYNLGRMNKIAKKNIF
jgi:glycosyltransferase involved in cell wall biosynthesis